MLLCALGKADLVSAVEQITLRGTFSPSAGLQEGAGIPRRADQGRAPQSTDDVISQCTRVKVAPKKMIWDDR